MGRLGRGERKEPRRQTLRQRIGQFLRSLFSSGPQETDDPRGFSGGVGVREPRKPLHPSSSGAVALEAPPAEALEVWAVGEEESG